MLMGCTLGYVGLTPARLPTPAPTTVVPAVAPSGMSFYEYPRVPPCVPWGARLTTSSTVLRTMECPFYDLESRIANHGGAPFTTSSPALRTMGCPLYDLESRIAYRF